MENKKHYLNLRIEEDLLNRLREYDNYSEFARNSLERQIIYNKALENLTDEEIEKIMLEISKIIYSTIESGSGTLSDFLNVIKLDLLKTKFNRLSKKELL